MAIVHRSRTSQALLPHSTAQGFAVKRADLVGHCSRSPAKSASKEIQAMIQEGSDDAERFGELVDVLLDSELPFKESSLGNGEWQVGLACLHHAC